MKWSEVIAVVKFLAHLHRHDLNIAGRLTIKLWLLNVSHLKFGTKRVTPVSLIHTMIVNLTVYILSLDVFFFHFLNEKMAIKFSFYGSSLLNFVSVPIFVLHQHHSYYFPAPTFGAIPKGHIPSTFVFFLLSLI